MQTLGVVVLTPDISSIPNAFFSSSSWAVSVVMSRNNRVPDPDCPEKEILCLIPLWDMINHRAGRVTTDVKIETKTIEFSAMEACPLSSEIFMDYGCRTSAEFLLYCGFVPPFNPHHRTPLILKLKPEPRLGDCEAVIRPTIAIVNRLSHQPVLSTSPPNENIVQQRPASRPRVHPRDLFPRRKAEEGVDQQETVFRTRAQKKEAVIVTATETVGTQHSLPGSVVPNQSQLKLIALPFRRWDLLTSRAAIYSVHPPTDGGLWKCLLEISPLVSSSDVTIPSPELACFARVFVMNEDDLRQYAEEVENDFISASKRLLSTEFEHTRVDTGALTFLETRIDLLIKKYTSNLAKTTGKVVTTGSGDGNANFLRSQCRLLCEQDIALLRAYRDALLATRKRQHHRSAPKETGGAAMLETRTLFGGAFQIQLPASFKDVSTFRQVPDNQEVFVNDDNEESVSIDILDSVTATSPGEAAR
ncbi:unnamed protein product [Schistocephalus solidus]|uniref:Rubis-subs-bind domain-containing protein n=1 Tax=Schistocephalus solidus TaxID=70667 RepID=A0A183SW34_SCHSO|nr:unnamed protein product [Schistocephalus solidus]